MFSEDESERLGNTNRIFRVCAVGQTKILDIIGQLSLDNFSCIFENMSELLLRYLVNVADGRVESKSQ